MIYGTPEPHLFRDVTDIIGIRTLILRQYWACTIEKPSVAELDNLKPDLPAVPKTLMLMGEQTMKEKGRYTTLWTFQGVNEEASGKDLPFKTRGKSIDYGFEPGFSQVPIQVFKDFTKLMDQFQGYPGNDGTTVIWPPQLAQKTNSGSALNVNSSTPADTNPMYGIQSFFEMDGVYRYRYAEKDLPKTLEDGVGYIAEDKDIPGNPPPLDSKDGRNWLKAPVTYQRKGYIYDITEYFWLSRRGGWPEPVYRKGFLK